MVVPTDPKLLSILADRGGVNLRQLEVRYRGYVDKMIPNVLWGAKPSSVDLIHPPEPFIARRAYKLTFDEPPKPGVPTQLILDVKLGPSPINASVFVNITNPVGNVSTFDAAGRCQEVARSWLPGLVPRVIRVGVYETDDGDVDYVVIEHIPNTVTLDKVWSSLTPQSQDRIMGQLVTALETLQKEHGFSEKDIEEALRAVDLSGNIDYTAPVVLNGPKTPEPIPLDQLPAWPPQFTSLKRVRLLLQRYANEFRPARRHLPATTFTEHEDGSFCINFFGADHPMDTQFLTCRDIQEIGKALVLCHMDLEPRNILVKLVEQPTSPDGKPEKELQLAGIVSWQKATFAPFSMERGLKDALLGCQFNSDYAWYRLFVERTKHLIPDRFSNANEHVLAAMVSMRFAARALDCNYTTTAHQQQFYAMEKITMTSNRKDGWVRMPGAQDHESPSDLEYREMGNGLVRKLLYSHFQTIPRRSWPQRIEDAFAQYGA
ncbi:hypothetical protein CNYM01_01055 [Colletotrichum nymphaeae SA-01]|uniref:Aminoglycoside phosphotransferase domain-containing protein n=1 Tax=Colletotrichum nymphaeae SA-01 TaxID=1460502 RepID=A0A135SEA8_9PEZI|nr:hypothetical protein CNYM01_01055 [Colletotrichum nymphaeae SA-01]